MRHFSLLVVLLVSSLLFTGCAVKKYSDISYLKKAVSDEGFNPKLNLFVPKKLTTEKVPVIVFVHGGNWNSGKKETYGLLGRNFAKKGLVCVIPDYTLSPKADYKTMTVQVAAAIKWVQKNIAQFHGDPKNIFLTGHSAGGHLVALAVLDPEYGIPPNQISGIILNDAAGLDMFNYLQNNPPTSKNNYISTWTTNPDIWKKASPIYYLNENTPPIKIYMGSKSYPSIITANKRFLKALHTFQPDVNPTILNKKHIPMVTQYFWPWSDRFQEISDFIKKNLQ